MNSFFKSRISLHRNGLFSQIISIISNNKHKINSSKLYLLSGIAAYLYLNSSDFSKRNYNKIKNNFKVNCTSQGDINKISSIELTNPFYIFQNKKDNHLEIIGNQGPIKNIDFKQKGGSGKVSISAIQINANNPIEDRILIQRLRLNLPNGKCEDLILSAVIDGHGGWQIAEYVQKNFIRIFQNEMNKCISLINQNKEFTNNILITETDIIAGLFYSLKRTYFLLDEELRDKLETVYNLGFSKLASVGACITASIITESAILTANSGDCLSIYCNESGLWLPMNEQLSAMNPEEQKRLENTHIHEKDNLIQCKQILWEKFLLGLYAFPKYKGCYLKGILQPSRAIGDFRLKYMDFNYNWDKDLSTEKLLSTFSYILQNQYENKEFPYSYDLINGEKSINLKRDSSRYFVKNPLSFPYVKSEPMLHLFFYNSIDGNLTSSDNTQVEKISLNEYSLNPKYLKNSSEDLSFKIEHIVPEHRYQPIYECANSSEFIKEYFLAKLKNIYSYFQNSLNESKKKFLVLGTDGVWDFLTPKDVTNIILKSKTVQESIGNILRNVLNRAGIDSMEKLNGLPKKRKVFDDTSVILVEISSNN